MSDSIKQSKSELRKRVRAVLTSMTESQRRDASLALCRRVMELPAFGQARTIMLYISLPNEIDVTPLIQYGLKEGRTVCVPKVDWERRKIEPVAVESLDDRSFKVDEHGLRVPINGRRVALHEIGVVIVPGLAFDAQGNRLGRNAGFYDRFLAGLNKSTTTIGVAFDRQVVDNVPVEPHDMAVDFVATESNVHTRETPKSKGPKSKG